MPHGIHTFPGGARAEYAVEVDFEFPEHYHSRRYSVRIQQRSMKRRCRWSR